MVCTYSKSIYCNEMCHIQKDDATGHIYTYMLFSNLAKTFVS